MKALKLQKKYVKKEVEVGDWNKVEEAKERVTTDEIKRMKNDSRI